GGRRRAALTTGAADAAGTAGTAGTVEEAGSAPAERRVPPEQRESREERKEPPRRSPLTQRDYLAAAVAYVQQYGAFPSREQLRAVLADVYGPARGDDEKIYYTALQLNVEEELGSAETPPLAGGGGEDLEEAEGEEERVDAASYAADSGMLLPDRYYRVWAKYARRHEREGKKPPNDKELSRYLMAEGFTSRERGRRDQPISPGNLRRYMPNYRIYHVWHAYRRQTGVAPTAEQLEEHCRKHDILRGHKPWTAVELEKEFGDFGDFRRRYDAMHAPVPAS
ncbi:hypothetical protein, partial [Streptomyces nanshensis]